MNEAITKPPHLNQVKRKLDSTLDIDPLPAKKARLDHQSDAHQLEEHCVEQPEKIPLQQPAPRRPCPSFLKDYVDTVHPDPGSHSVYTRISEWLETIGKQREKRCRSDNHLQRSDDRPISRQLTRSAPAEMVRARDADGFAIPPTPASSGSRSYQARDTASATQSRVTGSGRSSAKTLVEDPFYRSRNLALNGIRLDNSSNAFPSDIADLVREVGKDRDSPGPTLDQVRHDASLHALEMEGEEPNVEDYFRSTIFPNPGVTESLRRSDKQPIFKHAVPSAVSIVQVSRPIPDVTYGYRDAAFPGQLPQIVSMGDALSANSQGLLCPFFVIEFKGDGPGGTGSLWVATNQCLGGSATCINIAERLNRQLRECKSDEVRPINSAVFSIAMNGSEARLFISWKHDDLDIYMRKIRGFLLQDPEHYIQFRKYVRNIIDWGKDRRLSEIRASLDTLLEENRKRASAIAKSRPPPSDASSSSKRRSSSSSGRKGSGSNSERD
ncbi:hypothetical protein ACRALDRAFT_1077331 [Sodiomyces alcalophilus JCM 7366]|uniref:uncharacterized protein n=1 Tax=Sodiomyces alcalophilus JCM 7366 TaxID=591952 RepID=UPI0039B6A7B9